MYHYSILRLTCLRHKYSLSPVEIRKGVTVMLNVHTPPKHALQVQFLDNSYILNPSHVLSL